MNGKRASRDRRHVGARDVDGAADVSSESTFTASTAHVPRPPRISLDDFFSACGV
jgi:hypothetical protein